MAHRLTIAQLFRAHSPESVGRGVDVAVGSPEFVYVGERGERPRRFTDLKLEKEMTHSETGLVGRGGQRVPEPLKNLPQLARSGTLLVCVPLSPPSENQRSFTAFLTGKLFYFQSLPPSPSSFLVIVSPFSFIWFSSFAVKWPSGRKWSMRRQINPRIWLVPGRVPSHTTNL